MESEPYRADEVVRVDDILKMNTRVLGTSTRMQVIVVLSALALRRTSCLFPAHGNLEYTVSLPALNHVVDKPSTDRHTSRVRVVPRFNVMLVNYYYH